MERSFHQWRPRRRHVLPLELLPHVGLKRIEAPCQSAQAKPLHNVVDQGRASSVAAGWRRGMVRRVRLVPEAWA